MNTKLTLSIISIALTSVGLSFAGIAQAHDDYRYKHHHGHEHVVIREQRVEYAPVVSAYPIYRTVAVEVPIDSCQVETVAYRERRGQDSFEGTVVGGLIGAAIGHELGHGSGHATAAGGLIGAAIGNNAAGGGHVTHYEDREVCRTAYRTEYERRLVGYDVSYSYYGRVYHTETTRHPGDRIRVNP